MPRVYINRHTGIAGQVPKQGKPQKPKDVTKKNAEKDICLNCERESCKGCGKKTFKKKKEKMNV